MFFNILAKKNSSGNPKLEIMDKEKGEKKHYMVEKRKTYISFLNYFNLITSGVFGIIYKVYKPYFTK